MGSHHSRRAACRPDPLAADLGPGLVLHLLPEVLEAHGATVSQGGDSVRDPHLFLCLSHAAGAGKWLPLFSRPGPLRFTLPLSGRTGHPKWIAAASHYHALQVWTATDEAVAAAAEAGHELSTPRRRNRFDLAQLPPQHLAELGQLRRDAGAQRGGGQGEP